MQRERGIETIEVPAAKLNQLIADEVGCSIEEIDAEQTFLIDRGEKYFPFARYAVINTEGVGQEEPDGGYEFEVYTQHRDGFYLAPQKQLIEAAQGGQKHDLADVIRVFGSRLESNFSTWRAWATGDIRSFNDPH